MPKTAAQRQADYRKRRPFAGDNGERRLNLWVTTAAALALQRLAHRYGVTQRQFLEQILLAEDKRITDTLDPDAPEWDDYYQMKNVTQ